MNVVITGVGSGIGKSVALAFLQHNHDVIGILRNDAQATQLRKEAKELSGSLSLIMLDLSDLEFFSKLQSEIQQLNVNSVDVLINVAGVLNPMNLGDISMESINKVMHVNFTVPTMLVQELLPLLKESKHANIINITSMSGFQSSVRFPGLSIYGASKAALASVTQSLSVELQVFNIYINALAIGAVNTAMLKTAFPEFEAKVSPSKMAAYIYSFATEGHMLYNGQVLPVAITNP